MPEKRLASAVLVSGFIGLSIEGPSGISWIDRRRFGTDLPQPIEEVGQVGNDARGVVGRTGQPAKPGGVNSGLAIEGARVQALCEILKQTMGIAFSRIDLKVFEEESNRPRYLPHPFQTPIVAPVQEVVDQRFENP
jgi:hypothetical protein